MYVDQLIICIRNTQYNIYVANYMYQNLKPLRSLKSLISVQMCTFQWKCFIIMILLLISCVFCVSVCAHACVRTCVFFLCVYYVGECKVSVYFYRSILNVRFY